MKTWMILAVVALAPLSVSAEVGTLIQANENSRIELIKDVERARSAFLPQNEPLPQVTVRYQPRLNDIKASIVSAKTPAELINAQKDLANWRAVVVADLFSANRQPAAAYGPVAAQHQEFAGQSFGAESAGAREALRNPGGTWNELFDNNSRFVTPTSDGAVRAAAPPAANDPARYAKIRALLLSKGVSSNIVDTAIAEGIRQKVDPMIVLSVINQESNFKKNAYNSGSDCKGLMQLAPATAADMGVHGNLYDPLANIKAGVKYMNWIANSFFKMNLDMSDLSKVPAEKLKIVLASYNWGIGNVSRIIKKYGAAGLDRVAPKETRSYIAEIPSRIYAWFASL